jgi:glycosyltransferase involved in cell wall biosynthesis
MDAIYLARDDAFDLESWSGTPYWMGKALASAGFNLSYVCPLKDSFRLYYKLKGKLIRILGWDYTCAGEWPFLRGYGRQATRVIRNRPGDIILSCGKPQLVFLETKRPVVFFDDASVPALSKTHAGHTHYFPPIQRRLQEAERRVLEKCRFACYASSWAAEGAAAAYGNVLASKIKVIPFGANVEVNRTREDIEEIIARRETGRCNLLFVGRAWESKGGPTALAAAEELHRRGINARLEVVGCRPSGPLPSFVRVHGFVTKKSADGRALLDQLFRESHFFILPTRYEAYGLVFVEASSYGLPSLGTAVGGVTTIISRGQNGQLFDLDAPTSQYADYVQELLKDPAAYGSLCRSSFLEYEQRLSWKRFGEAVRELVSSAGEERA